ncbi:MAG TPA: hydrogenase expression/formation protein HypE [Candidatus Mediterraneibacter pullistercoris]|nr:hydrogenase expression/formation protein HypE [Candidatus Mediterraneibacter pullistercoris]
MEHRITDDRITLDYGSGGSKTSELIESILLPAFDNTALSSLGDGAILSGSEKLVFSTDSFVVSPWRFPGGDIGRLSVCGTVNDLCMAGGEPKYLSLSFILEEGFSFSDFRSIVSSIAEEAKEAGVSIVTGDTKVVDSGKGDGIYINTAGIGFQRAVLPGKSAIRPGDAVLISGSIGCHGAAVMMARSGLLRKDSPLVSDCQPLHRISAAALEAAPVRILRDPTRGGVATTLNEFTEQMPFSIELDQSALPIDPAVEAACDMLGLDPLYCACEGRMLAVCGPQDAGSILDAIRKIPGGENAAQIGTVTEDMPGRVLLKTPIGGRRILSKLTGIQLPRIC